MDICFCCCDSLAMDLVRLTCCKKTIHRQCPLAYLGTNSQCCYCRCPVDMAKVMGYKTIDRSLPKPLTPVKTAKCDLQQMLMDEKTPLRDADRVHSESNEKNSMAKISQANRMICQQGKDIANQVRSPGAVVVVQVDYRAVNHAIGIVGVIYQIASSGGARIATVSGLLPTGSKKANWWIPSNRHVIKYHANEVANIALELEIIRQSILSGEYNDKSATRCTIQEAHQVITEAISPCRKSKCTCAHGLCMKGRWGCIKKATNVPVHAVAMAAARPMKQMVNEFYMLCVRVFLLMTELTELITNYILSPVIRRTN
jgi:hypothetical protein